MTRSTSAAICRKKTRSPPEADSSLQALVQSTLLPREKVVWTERPDARHAAIQSVPIVLFGIPWTAFSLTWEGCVVFAAISSIGGINGHGGNATVSLLSLVFVLFGMPFVLIGFGMLLAPYFAFKQAAQTAYVVSNLRAMEIIAGRKCSVRSFYARDIKTITTSGRLSALKDVVFSYSSDGDGGLAPSGKFNGIRDAVSCEQALRRLSELRE